MRTLTRRSFLIASAALPIGCAANRLDVGIAASAPSAALRQPMTGQTWRYGKHDLFTGALLDTQVDQVSTVDRTIGIESHTEGDTAASTSSGASWWRNLLGHPKSAVALPTEIQSSWGMVLVDPHWGAVQVYEPSIPLWPTTLQPGWYYLDDSVDDTQAVESSFRWELLSWA